MLQHKPRVAHMNSIDAAALHEHQTAFDAARARLEQEETRVNGPPHISPWSPHRTLATSSARTHKIEMQLAQWSAGWWQTRGYTVERELDGTVRVLATSVA